MNQAFVRRRYPIAEIPSIRLCLGGFIGKANIKPRDVKGKVNIFDHSQRTKSVLLNPIHLDLMIEARAG